MPTYRKRGDRWQALVRKQTPDRKRMVQESQTFPTKTQAQHWATKLELSIEMGLYPPADAPEAPAKEAAPSLRSVIERYLSTVSTRHKGYAVEVDVLRRIIDGHKRGPGPLLDADKPITDVTPQDIVSYRDKRLAQITMRGAPVNPGTVRRELSLLGRVFTVAKDEFGVCQSNPCATVKLPKEPRARDRRLKVGELEALIGSITNERAKDAILLALHTGMRRSEIARTAPHDVDLERRTITLHDTKNGEKRIVPLSPEAIETASRCLQRAKLMGFKTLFGLSEVSITHAFEAACKKAGIADLRLHDLRHEATSRFFEMGLSIPEVAAITGHKTWSMLRRYTQLKPEDIAAKLETLNRVGP